MKLAVGEPGDRFEQEADRVSDEVMRMPAASSADQGDRTLLRAPITLPRLGAPAPGSVMLQAAGGGRVITNDSAPPEPEDETGETPVQTKARGTGAPGERPPQIEADIRRVASGPGEPLSKEARSFLEPRFGHDFGGVRVFADRDANAAAEGLGARAFTLGRSVFFAAGEYQTRTAGGLRLLAHELTHVLQQTGGRGAAAAPEPARVQRTPSETRASCPAYFEWDRSIALSAYNCAGLAYRSYDFQSLATTRANMTATGYSIGCGARCNPGQIKHWLWEYDTQAEVSGRRVGPTRHDFHTVGGMVDPRGADPADVYTKNGARPVHGMGTGPSFRPAAREQDTTNDASETPRTLPDGTPIFKLRDNMTDACSCTNCPGFIGPPTPPP